MYAKADRGLGTGSLGPYARAAGRASPLPRSNADGGDGPGPDEGVPREAEASSWAEALAGDWRWTPADQVAFKMDLATWLGRLTPRRRLLAELLSRGHRTGEVARDLGVSPAAVSQARAWLRASWRSFQGGP
jgi:hypothetical protein